MTVPNEFEMKAIANMHSRSVLAIARKDALDAVLNKATLVMLLTPFFLALVFLLIDVLLSNHTTNVMVYNPGKSAIEQIVDHQSSGIKVTYVNSPDQVTAAFGPNGSKKDSSYELGLIVPPNFDADLRARQHPQLTIYINGSDMSNEQSQLLLNALNNYTRSVVNPQTPATIMQATINPPSSAANPFQDVSQIYAVAALLGSLVVGAGLVPHLLVEEKERKTLRMLMASPASFADVIVAKLLVGLFYQFLLALLAVAITGGFGIGGQIPMLLLFILLGSFFSVSAGLLIGSFVNTTGAASASCGVMSFLYVLPLFFVGPFAQLLGSSAFTQIIKILPTYYIADGASNAITSANALSTTILDMSVTIGFILALMLLSLYELRRQAALVSAI
jgi:ABC-2 type transport system permease protein